MAKTMALSDNYVAVSQEEALGWAQRGYLVVSTWINPQGGSGHVATLSVGDNAGEGREYANIGPKRYTGFTSFSMTYGKSKQPSVNHYVYMCSDAKPAIVRP